MLNSIPQPKSMSTSLNTEFSDLDLGVRKPLVKGKGKVKSVLSGDTIVVKGATGKEKRLVISGVNVPRVGGKKENDEPFGYHAREFLRARLLDQTVDFVLQQDSASGREYATVTIGKDDVATLLVKAGLGKVNLPKKIEEAVAEANANKKKKDDMDLSAMHPEKQALYALQLKAEEQKLGMFAGSNGVRNLTFVEDVSAVYNKYKGKTVNAYVDRVLDGSTLRLELVEDASLNHTMVVVCLAGVIAPRTSKDTTDGKQAAEFVEARIAGRTIQFTVVGMDKSNNVYGTVIMPQGNIAVRLLETGLGTYVPWTAALVKDNAELKKAARATDGAKNEFHGVVTQVLSGDTIIVRNQYANDVKVSLSSVQVPRVKNGKSEPYAFEAKEFLRKLLIGAKVLVSVDYERELKKDNGSEHRPFVTITKGTTNVSVELLSAGLGEVVALPRDADRAANYGALVAIEQQAKNTEKGIWSKKAAPVAPVDYTNTYTKKSEDGKVEAKPVNKAADEKLEEISKKIASSNATVGVLEAVYGPTRAKVYIPSQNAYVSVSLAAVAGPAVADKKAKSPTVDAALAYLRQFLQHDIVIEGTNSKSKGIFANLSDKATKVNFAVALLEQGLVSTIYASADKNKNKTELLAAEAKAKKAKTGVWVDYDEEKERAESEKARAEANENLGAGVYVKDGVVHIKIKVTDVVDPVHFYFNCVEDKNIELVRSKLDAYVPTEQAEGYKPTVGSVVLAKFDVDEKWYRGRVDGVSHGLVAVQYIDFGNVDKLPLTNIRPCPEDILKIKPLARPATLSGLRTPPKDTDYFENATEAIAKMIQDGDFEARVDFADNGPNGILHVTLFHESDTTSINAHMLKLGHASVNFKGPRKIASLASQLVEFEQEAKDDHKGIWEYGVIDMDAPEDN